MAAGTDQDQMLDYEHFIDFQLDRARTRIKAVELGTGFVRLLTAAIVYVLTVVTLDHAVVLPRSVRLVLLLLASTAAVAYLALAIVVPGLRRINAFYAARTIERAVPDFYNSLVNFLDLRRRPQDVPPRVLAAIEERAVADLSRVQVEEKINQEKLVRASYGLGAAVLAVCAGVLFNAIFMHRSLADSLGRALLPTADIQPPTKTRLTDVLPGKDPDRSTVVAGTEVTVSAIAQGREPQRVTLYWSDNQGKSWREQELRAPERQFEPWQTRLPAVDKPFDYYLVGGDCRTEPFSVQVVQAPMITEMRLSYRYPEYTGWPPYTSSNGNIDALEGTRVAIRATTNQSARSGQLRFGPDKRPGPTLRLAPGSENQLETEYEVGPNDTTYIVWFETMRGDTNPKPVSFEIKVRHDLPPTVSIHRPGKDLVDPPVSANAVIPIEVEAGDDFAVQHVKLYVTRGEESLASFDFMQDKPPAKEFHGTHWLDLGPLQLAAGDEISYWAEAVDSKSSRTKTTSYRIRLGSPLDPEERSRELARADDAAKAAAAAEQAAADEPSDKPNEPDKANEPETPTEPDKAPQPGEQTEPTPQRTQEPNSDKRPDDPVQKILDFFREKDREKLAGDKDQSDPTTGQQKSDKDAGKADADTPSPAKERRPDSGDQPPRSADRSTEGQDRTQDGAKRDQEAQPEGSETRPSGERNKPAAGANKDQNKPATSGAENQGSDAGKGEPGEKPASSRGTRPSGDRSERSGSNSGQTGEAQERKDSTQSPDQRTDKSRGKPDKQAGGAKDSQGSGESDGQQPGTETGPGQTERQPGGAERGDKPTQPANSPSRDSGQPGDAQKNGNRSQPGARPNNPASRPGSPPGSPGAAPGARRPNAEPSGNDPSRPQGKQNGERRPTDAQGTADDNQPARGDAERPSGEPGKSQREAGENSATNRPGAGEKGAQRENGATNKDGDGQPGNDSKRDAGSGSPTPTKNMTPKDGSDQPKGAGAKPTTGKQDAPGSQAGETPGDDSEKGSPPSSTSGGKPSGAPSGSNGAAQRNPAAGGKQGEPKGGDSQDSGSAPGPSNGSKQPAASREPGTDKGDAPDGNASQPDGKDSGKPGGKPGSPSGGRQGGGRSTPQSGSSGSSPTRSTGEPGSQASDRSSGSGGNLESGERTEDARPGGGPNRATRTAREPGDSVPSPASPDAPNRDYSNAAVNLVLERLSDQVQSGDVDPELLQRLGWTREQLEQFVEEFHDPGRKEGDAGGAAAKRQDKPPREPGTTLKEKRIGNTRRGPGATAQDDLGGNYDAGRRDAPFEYRDIVDAYTKSRSQPAKPATTPARTKQP